MKLDDLMDASQSSGCVEPDSEAEHDLEVQLYSELYFEPNPDFVPLATGLQDSCSAGKNGVLHQVETHLPISDLPPESANDVPLNPRVTEDEASPQDTSQAQSGLKEKTSLLKIDNNPFSIDEVPLYEEISPVRKIEVETPTVSRYVFSMKKTPSSESDFVSRTNFLKIGNTLSSTPVNAALGSFKRNNLLCANSLAKDNVEVECLKMPRKRVSASITGDLANCKRSKMDDDVISVSSGCSEEEPSSVNRNSTTISSSLGWLKKKVAAHNTVTKFQPKTMKRSLTSRQRTTFVAGDSSDSEESLLNDSLVCNFSLDVEGRDESFSATSTRQNRRIDWPMDYTSTRNNRIRTSSVQHWTPHMVSFYDSDISDDYEIDHLQNTMPDDVMEWEMEADDFPDQLFGGKGKPRYFDSRQIRRCKRCRAYDHTLSQCRRLDYCRLCGDTSHYVREDCPNNCCFRCGQKYHTFCPNTCPWNRCDICHNKGHTREICPDLWRRFAFTTSGAVPVHPGPRSSHSVRLPTCFSCGQSGHLGPDCAHRVQNYIVLHQEVQSYAPPTRNCLGLTVLTEDLQEQPQEVDELYGETVQRYTSVRASVSLESSQVGFIIGKKGNLIHALRRLFACKISVVEDNSNSNFHLMWIKGARLDEALRCILFLLNREADLTDVRQNMEKLDQLTDTKTFTQLWRRKMNEFRRSMHEMNEKTRKEKENSYTNATVYQVASGSEESIVCISDSEEEKISYEELHKSASLAGRKFSLKRSRDEEEESDDSDLEFKIKAGIALKKSKTVIGCEDSKYAAFDKLKNCKKNSRPTLASLENCSSDDETDLGSCEARGDDDASSDDEYDVNSSNEDDELVSDVSFDEMSLASSIEDPDAYNLPISAEKQAKLECQKSKRFKTLLQSLPMGRKSLIHAVNEKLAKANIPINVDNCVAKIKLNCYAYRENKSDETLQSIRSSFDNLGSYILGGKGLGIGKNLKKEIQRRLSVLERSSSRVVSVKEREALATALFKIVSADFSSLEYIIRLAESLGNEKENKGKAGNTSVHSRLSFLNKSSNSKNKFHPNCSNKQLNRKSMKNFRSFKSIHDIENLDEHLDSSFFLHSHYYQENTTSGKRKINRSKSANRSPNLRNKKASRSLKNSKRAKQRASKVVGVSKILKKRNNKFSYKKRK